MAGNLTPEELAKKVRAGEIDTVLAVMVDMHGRFMGKRVTGRFFVDEVARSGTHACSYLLTVDLDMEPIPGYTLASWDTGYQDFRLLPDWNTLRLIPWLSKTALVICDVVTTQGDAIEESPRQILKRQIEKARNMGFLFKTASELEFYLFKDTYESARQKDYHHLQPSGDYVEDYHILQISRDESLIRQIRNGMEGAAIPVEFSKGEWGMGQQEIALSFDEALEMAAPARDIQKRSEGDRLAKRRRRHFHGEVQCNSGRFKLPPALQSLACQRKRQSFLRPRDAARHVRNLPPLSRRTDDAGPGVLILFFPDHKLLQALSIRDVCANSNRVGARQQNLRVPHRRRKTEPSS